jgi:ribosome-binding factor A
MSLRVEAGFEHLKDAFAQVLAEDVEFPKGVLVTVLSAKITASTGHAKFVMSVFPENMKDEVIRTLEEFDHEIKDGLAKGLRLRRMPRIHYAFDDTEAHASIIDNALLELRKKGEV